MRGRWQAACARVTQLAQALAAARWTKPALRVLAAGAGLLLLAAIGRTATASGTEPTASPMASPTMTATATATATATPTPTPTTSSLAAPPTPEAPLVLNAATAEDLQRLPGIGPKKAQGIVALRQRLGRFRQVEDLMKVKGIGRATVKRLRPLVRVDAPPQPPPVTADASTT